MTLDEFLVKLAHTVERSGWELRPKGGIREIMGRCPMEAVAGIDHHDCMRAAELLGFDGELRDSVIAAADRRVVRRKGHRELRRRLLRAVGLVEA